MWFLLTPGQGYPVPSVLNVSKDGSYDEPRHDPVGGDPIAQRARSIDVSLAPVQSVESAINDGAPSRSAWFSKPGVTVLGGKIPASRAGRARAARMASEIRVATWAPSRCGPGSSHSSGSPSSRPAWWRKDGGSSSSDSRSALWQPCPRDRWQYQLESSNRHLASTGGIDVSICQAPAFGWPLCPPRRVRHRPLRRRSGLGERPHDRHGRRAARSTTAGLTRSATCRPGPPSAFAPTIPGTWRSTAAMATA